MKLSFCAVLIFLSSFYGNAQTWTGNTSTDWNTPSNWSPANVPLGTGNVTIPTAPTGNRWPVLAQNVTINSFNMNTGSQLNVNGFIITTGDIDLRGTVNNTNGGTDIRFILTGTATTFIRNATFNDAVVYTMNGSAVFYDTYAGNTANTYNGNVTYVRNSGGATYIGFYARNTYGGNVTISNSVTSLLDLFQAGADITGNLALTSVGGNATVGNDNANTLVGGTINISATTNGVFGLYRVINQQAGGTIALSNRGTTDFHKDTLKINSITITEQSGAMEIDNNKIQGNLSYSSAAVNSSTSFVRNNEITGTVTYSLNGTNVFYDTYSSNTANKYTGNVTYTRNGTGTTYIGYYGRNSYTGNVTIANTVSAALDVFKNGADISGNLSVSSGGGAASIGNPTDNTLVGGTLTVTGTATGVFSIERVINQQTGGSITLTSRTAVYFHMDTLKVTAINISEQNGPFEVDNNKIQGAFTYSSANANANTSFVRSNEINGTVSFTLKGTNTFYDNFSANTKNIYTGNVTYTRSGTGATYIGFYDRNDYTGNVTVTCTAIALLDIFNSGADISGNLNVSSAGGNASIGILSKPTIVGGALQVSGTTSGNFDIYHLVNQQAGGSISLVNRATVHIQSDTLIVNSITITGQSGVYNFDDNKLTGNLVYSSANTNTSTSFVRNNTVLGNATYTMNGAHTFYDSYSGSTGNYYSGNLSYTRNSTGALYVGYYDTLQVGGNLSFNYSLPGTVDNRFIAFVGSAAATLSQDGTLPLAFDRISIKKTGVGSLTLDDSVRISDRVYFGGGNIITANQKELIWLNSAQSITPSDTSHVVGPVVKIGSQAFVYPVGSSTAMQSVTMTAPVGLTTRFRCEYFPVNPHPTYDTSKRAGGLAAISGCEYWKLDRELGITDVTLTFEYGGPCLCVEMPTNLRVARWSGSQWSNLGNGGTTGTIQGGLITTAAAVTDYGVFSLGSSATVSPAITIIANVSNPVCVCRKVTFTATPGMAGCSPGYQWKKNGVNVGTNANTYTDSTLVTGDVISVLLSSSAAFSVPATKASNSINITTTDINTWAGTTSTNWHVASNWSCQSVPCELSKVVVNSGTPNACEILSGQVKIISLTANNASTVRILNGSTLELKQP